ncbi:ABC transporter [Amycolatopsis sp. WAC 04182]|uniref:ATP-binding cassette domain-containing protein n=1 Tax=Amycolatopsis sp. WAC 04182 TaxID=2203198 RepID=UPI000F79EB2C|nr:ATP-binding cassette domain-containing protein [Amycolatopsis sp. WAC 04182]RSN61440.1 ABC transporter [Amycolatopsis sp. WAC 04182]
MNPPEPALSITFGIRSWRFTPGQIVTIGRSGHCDVLVDDARVSREHLRISYDDGWTMADLRANSTTMPEPLAGSRSVLLAEGLPIELAVEPSRRNAPSGTAVSVGRARDNDLIVNDVRVSRHHARLERSFSGWRVTDLGPRNRTLLNAVPISGPTPVFNGDRLTFGGTDLLVDGDDFVPAGTTRAALVARHLGYSLPGGRKLLVGVDLEAGPGELVAILGPSGAGKSTLLKVLSGELRPETGTVHYDDYEVHDQYAAVRSRIGLVPQEDLVHSRLTGRQALTYAADLRLPDDTSKPEVRARVEATLHELGLTEHADVRIARLSGGQRKRVSVALELLTSPSLLFLDEPTSGLDPALDRLLMSSLRKIADAGRTVVLVTHNVLNLGQCDKVVLLAPGGIPAFTGAPGELRRRFGTDDWADIITSVVEKPPALLADDLPRRSAAVRKPRDPGVRKPAFTRQVRTLARRHTRLIFADPGYAIFLAVLPAALALLALTVPGRAGLRNGSPTEAAEAGQILVLLFIGAAFMGGAAAAREVIGERSIALRERAAGLLPAAYSVAKAGMFCLVCGAQSALLVGVLVTVKPRPVDGVALGSVSLELAFAVWGTATTSCLFSLLASALVRSSEQAMPVLVVTVMAQLVLCGGMIPVTGRAVLNQLSWFVPARWGYAAGAATVDLNRTGTPPDVLWTHAPHWWLLSIAVLAVTTILCAVLLTVRMVRLCRA